MKKLVKIIPVLTAIMMIVSVVSPVFAATDPSGVTISPSTAFDSIGGKIIGMVQAIGNILSILVLIVIGIKYMIGSAEEKAEYKKTLIPYLIGAILVFAAANVAKIVYNFASTVQ